MSSAESMNGIKSKADEEPIDLAFMSYREKVEHFRKFESAKDGQVRLKHPVLDLCLIPQAVCLSQKADYRIDANHSARLCFAIWAIVILRHSGIRDQTLHAFQLFQTVCCTCSHFKPLFHSDEEVFIQQRQFVYQKHWGSYTLSRWRSGDAPQAPLMQVCIIVFSFTEYEKINF